MTDSDTDRLRMRPIGGMLVGYYLLCPRQAWLTLHEVSTEYTSDLVHEGRVLSDKGRERSDREIFLEATSPDGIPLVGVVDRMVLREGVVQETKNSKKAAPAHRYQLKFYLWLLNLCGVRARDGRGFRGQLRYPRVRKTEDVMLTREDGEQLRTITKEIARLWDQACPPARKPSRSYCSKCSFEPICYF